MRVEHQRTHKVLRDTQLLAGGCMFACCRKHSLALAHTLSRFSSFLSLRSPSVQANMCVHTCAYTHVRTLLNKALFTCVRAGRVRESGGRGEGWRRRARAGAGKRRGGCAGGCACGCACERAASQREHSRRKGDSVIVRGRSPFGSWQKRQGLNDALVSASLWSAAEEAFVGGNETRQGLGAWALKPRTDGRFKVRRMGSCRW